MERAPVPQPGIRNLGFKVGLLLTLIPFIAIGLVLYALYARGVFESYLPTALDRALRGGLP